MTQADPALSGMSKLAATARALLDSIFYLTLATVDADRSPRVSPVYYTPHEYSDLYWVSHPGAQHSLNIARDKRTMAVVFDSTVPVGAAEAVYLTGSARLIPEAELTDRCPIAFSDRGGASVMTPDELSGDAPLRLYVLHIETAEALVRGGHPTLVDGGDRRVTVALV